MKSTSLPTLPSHPQQGPIPARAGGGKRHHACGLLLTLAMLLLAFVGPVLSNPEDQDEGTLAYQNGDFTRAFQIWNRAAHQGDHRSQFLLSTLYVEGRGAPKDDAEAAKWLNSAASGGFAPAQFNMGNNFYNGLGVPKDQAKAVEWWTRSARQGFVQAQYNLGVAYLTGKGVEKDNQEAVRWFSQAAIAGSDAARDILDQMGIDIYGTRAGEDQPAPGPTQASASAPIAPTSTPSTAKGILNTQWLAARDPGHYTVQVFSTPDADKAQALARRIASSHPVAIYPFQKNSARWHSLVVGSYPSKSSANQAMQGLPLAQWKTTGWTRSFASIQRIMQPQ